MKVKIKSCTNKSWWYRDSIGKTYEARSGTSDAVLVRADDGFLNYIFKGDYDVVPSEEYVKIKECGNSGLWYNTEVGKTFPVVHQTERAFWCGGILGNQNAWVYKEDCEYVFG